MSEPNNDRQHLTDHTKQPIARDPMRIPFKTFPADRISDDKAVEDRIQAAVFAERERCIQICNDYRKPEVTAVDVIAARIRGGK